jgi:hypothetical protein
MNFTRGTKPILSTALVAQLITLPVVAPPDLKAPAGMVKV